MAEIVVKLVNGELAGKTMQSITKEVNAAAQALKKAEIGTQAWVDANKRLEEAKGLQEDLKKQIQSTAAASDMLKAAWNKLPGAQFFNAIGDALGTARSGVGGLVRSMGILKTAIISTGIGALVVLLGSLYAWFTKTERGGDLLAKASSAIGAAWSVLIDRGSKLIDALIAFGSGNWSEAADKFAEATSGVVDEIVRETQAAWDLADALDALEELEGKMIVVRSRAKEQISELRRLAKDEDVDLNKRIAAIRQAISVTEMLNQKELEAKEGRILQALQVRDLDELTKNYGVTLKELLANAENILTVDNLGLGESTQDDLNKAFEAIAAYNEQLASSNDEQRTLMKDLNTLRKKDTAENVKDIKEILKEEQAAAKLRMEIRQNIEDLTIAAMQEGADKQIAQINLDAQRKMETISGTEDEISIQMRLIEEQRHAAIEAVRAKLAEDAKKAAIKRALDTADLIYTEESNLIKEQYLNGQINIIEFGNQEAELALQTEQKKLDILKAAHGEQSLEYQRAYGEFLMHTQAFNDQKSQIESQALMGSLGTMAGFFGSMAGLYEQGSAQYKQFAIAQAIVSTIQSAINAYMSASAIPVVGTALAPIAAAAALAAGYAQVRQIRQTKIASPVKKELGGPLVGPRHSQGGIPIEAEGGEFIFSRKAVQALGVGNLTAINDRYTRRMATGGPTDPFERNVNGIRSSTSSSSTTTASMGVPGDEVYKMIDAINRRIDRIKVHVVATEIQEVVTNIDEIKADVNF